MGQMAGIDVRVVESVGLIELLLASFPAAPMCQGQRSRWQGRKHPATAIQGGHVAALKTRCQGQAFQNLAAAHLHNKDISFSSRAGH